jgi:hypothetical protein
MRGLIAVIAATLAAQPLEPGVDSITWLGRLETSAGGVDGTVSASLQLLDVEGGVVSEVLEPSLLVVDGDFVVDFLIQAPLDESVSALFVAAAINGARLEPTLPLALSWPAAVRAREAVEAQGADVAEQIGELRTGLSRARLASSVAVPFSVVTGFPAAFLDGDQGLVFAAGATIDFTNGVVGIKAGSLPTSAVGAPLAGTDIAGSTLTTDDLQDGGVTAADLSDLPLTKLAPRTLTSRHFGTAGQQLYEVTEPNCRSNFVGEVTDQPTCTFTGTQTCTTVLGNVPVTGHVPCAAAARQDCLVSSTSDCPNAIAGVLVFR